MSESATVPRRADATAAVGFAIFVGALAMLFAALFFAYAVMRAQAPAWPPPGVAPLPRVALGVNTVILCAASLALRAARAATARGEVAAARGRAVVALALGAAFLGAQVVVWRSLVAAGAGPDSGIYGSVFFAISGFHALHVVGGLIALAALVAGATRARLRTPSAAAPGGARPEGAPLGRRLRLCIVYWDFVLVVWVVFYLGACLA